MTTRAAKITRIATLFLAACVGAAAIAAVGAGTAAAAPAATEAATNTCWKDVVNDWFDNNQVDGTYAIPCYTQAIQHLNEYPDIQNYSNAIDDIHRALLAAIRQDHPGGPGGGQADNGPSSGGGISGGGGGNNNGTGGSSGPSASGHTGPLTQFGEKLRPANAQSVPLPLIVLGGLASLLLLGALTTWGVRRFQARRGDPAPAGLPRS